MFSSSRENAFLVVAKNIFLLFADSMLLCDSKYAVFFLYLHSTSFAPFCHLFYGIWCGCVCVAVLRSLKPHKTLFGKNFQKPKPIHFIIMMIVGIFIQQSAFQLNHIIALFRIRSRHRHCRCCAVIVFWCRIFHFDALARINIRSMVCFPSFPSAIFSVWLWFWCICVCAFFMFCFPFLVVAVVFSLFLFWAKKNCGRLFVFSCCGVYCLHSRDKPNAIKSNYE